MNIKTSPAVAQLGKLRTKMAASEAEGFKGKLNQAGINMVDLMMWLVIAALLLAAALQGIGYYQQAAWTYQAKSDVAAVRTYIEANYTLNDNVYPTDTALQAAITAGDLKLTDGNAAIVTATSQSGWSAEVQSASLEEETKPHVFAFTSESDNSPVATATEGVAKP